MNTNIVACAQCGKKNRVPAAASGTPHCAQCGAVLPWVADAGDDDFAAVVEQSSLPVIVDLWAPWCGPCRMISPALERLAQSHTGALKVVKVNVDEEPQLGARYGVQGIPLLVLVRDGRELDRLVGAAPERQIEAWLRQHVSLGAGAPA